MGRLEMNKRSHDVGHASVFRRRLTRQSVDDVPVETDAELRAPLHQSNVLKRGHSLTNRFQDRVAQALDPRLNRNEPRIPQLPHLILSEIRLRLTEQPQIVAGVAEPGQEFAEVAPIKDVIDD